MATKKSIKKQPTKNKKHLETEHKRMGKLVVIFGVLLVCILAVFFAVKSDALFCDYASQQKLHAFEGLAKAYLEEQFEKDGDTAVFTGEMGVTDDKDLYLDFIIAKYEDRVIVSTKNARLHFQCHDENFKWKETGCAYAYWYDKEKEVSDENQEAQREFVEAAEALVDASNSGADEAVIKHLREEYQKAYENIKPFFEKFKAPAEL